MVYIALNINIYKAKSLCININKIWIYQFLFIIDKLNIIYLGFLAIINKYL